MGAVKKQVTSQPFINKTGNLKFLDEAEKKAIKLNEVNRDTEELVSQIPEYVKQP